MSYKLNCSICVISMLNLYTCKKLILVLSCVIISVFYLVSLHLVLSLFWTHRQLLRQLCIGWLSSLFTCMKIFYSRQLHCFYSFNSLLQINHNNTDDDNDDIFRRHISATVDSIQWSLSHLLIVFKLEECNRATRLCIGSRWRTEQHGIQSTLWCKLRDKTICDKRHDQSCQCSPVVISIIAPCAVERDAHSVPQVRS